MHKSVSRRSCVIEIGKTTVPRGQCVAELQQLTPRVLRRVRRLDSVMQMDFNFSPPGMAMLCQAVDQVLLVLLGGIKISVHEWPPVTVSVGLHHARILPAPRL